MRLLLDTHAFLWFIQGNNKLSDVARAHIEDQAVQKLISVASLWEIAIKVGLGRLEIGMGLSDLVKREILDNAFDVLNIQPLHLEQLTSLPFHHKDPFDRLIIAQGLTESIAIISKDQVFNQYDAKLIW